MTPTSVDKWRYSLWSAFAFALVSHPIAYSATNRVFDSVLSNTNNPTPFGLLLHTFVFFLVIRVMMSVKNL